MAPNIRFSRRTARSPSLRAASSAKLSRAKEMFADMRLSIATSLSVREPGSRLVISSTPTLRPLQVSGTAAAAPTCPCCAPCRQASERRSLRKSFDITTSRSRKAWPHTPEPSGVPSTIEISMLRSRTVSSPKPAAKRNRLVPSSSRKTAVARKSPLKKAASQTLPYNSSGDFAYKIASLVALSAANVRARSVGKLSAPWATLFEPSKPAATTPKWRL